MSTYISIYTGNPTKDMNDGTVVSENGSFTSPLTVTLNATKEEVKYIKCAVRCMSGYATVGDTVLTFEGANKDRWQMALDNDYDDESIKSASFNSSLVISDEIENKNKIFWVRASSVKTETPSNDQGVSLKLDTTIKAVD